MEPAIEIWDLDLVCIQMNLLGADVLMIYNIFGWGQVATRPV